MTTKAKPIPDGYHAITPYLTVKNGGALVAFLEKALGATIESRTNLPNGDLWHAEVQIGDSHVMIGGASEEWPERPAQIYFYAEDADATYARAVAAGATSIMEPMDMFYGDRHGGVTDPSGNNWWIATHMDDVSPEELQRRGKAEVKKRAKAGGA